MRGHGQFSHLLKIPTRVCVCKTRSPPPSDLSPPANILMKVVFPVPADTHTHTLINADSVDHSVEPQVTHSFPICADELCASASELWLQLTVLSQHHHDLRVRELSSLDLQRELAHRLLHVRILNDNNNHKFFHIYSLNVAADTLTFPPHLSQQTQTCLHQLVLLEGCFLSASLLNLSSRSREE